MSTDEAKSRMQRILRLHEEMDRIKVDIREVYGEEKAAGGDKTAMGNAIAIIRKREKDPEQHSNREAMVETYLAAFDGPSRTHAPARTREEPNQTAGSASSLSGNAVEQTPVAHHQEAHHDARRPELIKSSAPTITEPQLQQPSGAGTGSAVRTGAPILAKPDPYDPGPIPAFLDRRIQREQAGA